jgi:hypothetical protein
MSFRNCSAGAFSGPVSVSSSLLAATMNHKSFLRKVPQLVSGALTGNNQEYGKFGEHQIGPWIALLHQSRL